MSQTESKTSMLVSSAILLRQAGYDQKAIEVLQLAINEDSKNTQAYVLLGALSQATKSYEKSEKYFREALLLEPNNGEALQGLGLFLLSQDRCAEAVPYLESHRMKNPNDLLSLDGLIECYSNLPDRKGELQETLQQIWENTENPEIGFRYARHLLEIGNREKAQELISFFIETSSNVDSLAQLAAEFYKQDDFESSSKLLIKAVKIDPQFQEGWRKLAIAFNNLKEFDKALESIERAISQVPTEPENWTIKSTILFGKGEYEGLLKSSEIALDLFKPLENKNKSIGLLSMRIYRVLTYIKLDDYDNVLQETNLAREEFPEFEIFYKFLVDYLLDRKQPEEALNFLRTAPTNALKNSLRPYKYKILHQMGRSKEAWKCIQPYLKKANEKDIDRLASIGAGFYYRGMTNQALSVYRQLKEFRPGNLRIANNLGYILIGEGDYLDALDGLREIANQPISTLFRDIARCNIAYIYNLKEDFGSAIIEIENVLNSEFTQEEVTLRVTFWINGSIIADPSPVPGRNISIEECALSCAVSSAIAIGDLELGNRYANKLKEISNNQTIIDMVLGTLELKKGNIELAKQFWTDAQKSATLETDRTALDRWLETSNLVF